MLDVCLMNLKKYNEGELVFKWVKLPQDDFNDVFGEDEFIICDFECELSHIEISEYENLTKLNELAEKYEELDEYEKTILQAILEAKTNDLSEAFEALESEAYVFYDENDFEELAERFVIDGLFGIIPKELEPYVDYKKIARDICCDGYTKTSVGMIYFY